MCVSVDLRLQTARDISSSLHDVERERRNNELVKWIPTIYRLIRPYFTTRSDDNLDESHMQIGDVKVVDTLKCQERELLYCDDNRCRSCSLPNIVVSRCIQPLLPIDRLKAHFVIDFIGPLVRQAESWSLSKWCTQMYVWTRRYLFT